MFNFSGHSAKKIFPNIILHMVRSVVGEAKGVGERGWQARTTTGKARPTRSDGRDKEQTAVIYLDCVNL